MSAGSANTSMIGIATMTGTDEATLMATTVIAKEIATIGTMTVMRGGAVTTATDHAVRA